VFRSSLHSASCSRLAPTDGLVSSLFLRFPFAIFRPLCFLLTGPAADARPGRAVRQERAGAENAFCGRGSVGGRGGSFVVAAVAGRSSGSRAGAAGSAQSGRDQGSSSRAGSAGCGFVGLARHDAGAVHGHAVSQSAAGSRPGRSGTAHKVWFLLRLCVRLLGRRCQVSHPAREAGARGDDPRPRPQGAAGVCVVCFS
jgi:hypothetical protein